MRPGMCGRWSGGTYSAISFEYLTPRIRITPKDLFDTPLESPRQIHFVCSPTRASQILHDAHMYGVNDWTPFTIYEPIPVSVPFVDLALPQQMHMLSVSMCSRGTACIEASTWPNQYLESQC